MSSQSSLLNLLNQNQFKQWIRDNRQVGFSKVQVKNLPDLTMGLTVVTATTIFNCASCIFETESELYAFLRTGGMQGEELQNENE